MASIPTQAGQANRGMGRRVQVYHHGSSVCAAKVRLVLFEKGIDWEGRYVDIFAGEQFQPEYVAINPRSVVPTLLDGDAVLTESTVICEYLDESFPGPRLKPPSAIGRARMRMWTKLVDEEIHPATRSLTYVVTHRHAILARGAAAAEEHIACDPDPLSRERKRRWLEDGIAAPDVSHALGVFVRLIRDMDALLANNEWLAGADYSLADTALTPYSNRLDMLGLADMWSDKPNFRRWFDAVMARRSFGPALFDYFPEDMRLRMRADGQRALSQIQRILPAW